MAKLKTTSVTGDLSISGKITNAEYNNVVGNKLPDLEEQVKDIENNKLPAITGQLDNIIHITKYESIAKYNYMKFKLKISKNTESVTLVTQGDSLTFGEDLTSSDKRVYTDDTTHQDGSGTTTIASKTYPEALRDGLAWSLNRLPLVKKRATGGSTVLASYNKWTNNPNADLHVLMFGHNDSGAYSVDDFINNYLKLIYRILDWGSAVVLLVPPPMQNFSEDLQNFRQAVYEIGKMLGIEVFDTKDFIDGYANVKIHQNNGTNVVDGVHFNGNGYPLIGYGVASKLLSYNSVSINKNSSISVNPWNKNISGCYILPLNVNGRFIDVGDGENTGRSINIRPNGNVIININAEEENLCLIPLIQGEENSRVLIQNNFNSSLTKYELSKTYDNIGYSKSVVFEKGTTMLLDKNNFTTTDINTKLLRVYKGFNSIKVNNIGNGGDDTVNLYGFYVCSIDDLSNDINITSSSEVYKNSCFINKKNYYLNFIVQNITSLTNGSVIAKIENYQYNRDVFFDATVRDNDWGVNSCVVKITTSGDVVYHSNDTLSNITPYAIYVNTVV